MSESRPTKRRPVSAWSSVAHPAAVSLLLLGSLTLYLTRLHYYQIGMAWDDAQYVQLAQSIAEGRDYVVDTGSGEVLPTRYPFGFPLILAAVYSTADGNLLAMQLVSLVFTVATTLLIALGWRYLGFPTRTFGLLVASLYAFSPMAVGMSRMVMSEPAFAFLALSALILTVRAPVGGHRGAAEAVLLGTAWLLASHLRTIGAVLLVSSAAYLVASRLWRKLAWALCGFAVSLTLVLITTSLEPHDVFNFQWYLGEFGGQNNWMMADGGWRQTGAQEGLISRAIQGVQLYGSAYLRDSIVPYANHSKVQEMLADRGLGFVPLAGSLLVVVSLLAGYVSTIRRVGFLPLGCYVLLYGIVTVLWPFRDARFLYGILPFLFGYLIEAALLLIRLAERYSTHWHWRRPLATGVSAVAVILAVGIQLLASLSVQGWTNHVPDLDVGASWIRANTPRDALIVAESNEIVYPYARRSTSWLPDGPSGLDRVVGGQRDVYLLIQPALAWEANGVLRYSARTQAYVRALDEGALPAELVFKNEAAMVRIYHLTPRPTTR